ncbi:hypothetical protein NODU109028_05945 [Nocardioides dubius]|uniref:Uncharacterized protein n=1 Tax=Nocardioides dubius TaxID=317019 RepID=A0ABP4ENU2_9ACTN
MEREYPASPREVLAAVLAARPRRFQLVRATSSLIHVRVIAAHPSGVEQSLQVHLSATENGTLVRVEPGPQRSAQILDEVIADFLARLSA